MQYISPQATLEPGVFVGRNVAILGPCIIKHGTIIEDNCIIGKPSRLQLAHLAAQLDQSNAPIDYQVYDKLVSTSTVIGEKSLIHSGTIIYSGVQLGRESMCEDRVVIRWDTTIGDYTKVLRNGFVGAKVTIGAYCHIGNMVGNDTVIGNYTTSFGELVHQFLVLGSGEQTDTYSQYDVGGKDPAPYIGDYVTIGSKALVVGGVTIESRSFVAAGAIVTKDIPTGTLVMGTNQHHSIVDLDGSLKDSYLSILASSKPDTDK